MGGPTSEPEIEASVEELRRVSLFAHLPEEQLRWIAGRGEEVRFEAGEKIASQGDPADGFYVVLEGATEWTRRASGREVHAVTLGPGEVFAELILLLGASYPTTGRATTGTRLYKLDPGAFWEMLDVCPQVRRDVLRIATERSQIHETVSNQQAKLVSLGTMSAGLAHELNNPAAAASRAAALLAETLKELRKLALALGEHRLTVEQRALVLGVLDAATGGATPSGALDPLERGDREDELADGLDSLGVEDAFGLAPTFFEAGLDAGRLEEIAVGLGPDAAAGVLAWLGAALAAEASAEEIRRSTAQISGLVGAMKEYTYMDETALQQVNIHEGLESTLTVLGHKLKGGVEVVRDYDEGLPSLWARGDELNQVWTNLVDNAVDAMGGQGHLTVSTHREGERAVVEIADDGPGVPQEIEDRIFEPYFTTKGVGEGSGLGLDISRRIVDGHGGDIRILSEPGDTRFRVRLPIEDGRTEE